MADDKAQGIPMWAFLILLFGGLVGLLFIILDPFHLVPDSQATALAGLFGAPVSLIVAKVVVGKAGL